MSETLKAPFVYFGGKSKVADLVWSRLGDTRNYVEPFAGSLAVLLGRPTPPGTETVNDKDALLSNFWRSLQADPAATAQAADWPVSEADLHARHAHLVEHRASLTARIMGDPHFYDTKLAGWWVWGINCWIGSGFCSGNGPWRSINGVFTNTGKDSEPVDSDNGVNKQLPYLDRGGRGINRKLPHLSGDGQGINRKRPHLMSSKGVNSEQHGGLLDYLIALSNRLRRVRVCCGDWSRVLGESVTIKNGMTSVFLDPPYGGESGREASLYSTDSLTVASDVRDWAISNGDNPLLRIALCGYEGEHEMPNSWECVAWKAAGGYGSQADGRGRENANRERIWFSPNCIKPDHGQALLF